ncbi:hypothetical protein E4U27_007374 [Claviceps purpurea]|nr:hypothetical protein E4U51_005925 [Claviceps purpurea]KAG6170484.1 hypothetical protein E4U27_007374 [Claviceps purpurea]KAG6314011.1 hypothetical protein E4U44_002167 [Claviceps purpurea]
MALNKCPFSLILVPTDESAQTRRLSITRYGLSRATQCHVTGSQILPGAGHNAPHLPLPQSVQRQEGVWSSRNHLLSTDQLAPNPLAELPTTNNLRNRAPFEAAAGEHRSEVLGVILKAHKAKATKEAQDRRNRNAQSSKRSRIQKSAEEKAKATKKEQEMKQELEDAKSESRRKDVEIERLRGVDAENERLRRENEELKQRK